MHKNLTFFAALLLLLSCSGSGPAAMLPISTFEALDRSLKVGVSDTAMRLAIVDNPSVTRANPSEKCIRAESETGGRVCFSPYSRNFDFTLNPPVFTVKVLSPGRGLPVALRMRPFKEDSEYPELESPVVLTRNKGAWETLIFDFSAQAPEDNVYATLEIVLPAGEWFLDDLMAPDDDLTSIALFKRYEGNPVFFPEGEQNWRDAHIANAGILNPSQTPTGEWMMYIRGTGHTPDYHDQIGLFTQPADDFHPFGPWKEYEGNPVIPFSP